MHPGTPRAHEGLPHASFRVVRRPSALGGELALDVATPYGAYQGISCRKPGYQAANVACAVALAEAFLARALPPAHVCESVSSCPTPGRFDVVRADPLALIDACHNPQSVETFLTAVRAVEPEVARRPQLLCAVLADKDVEGIVRLLAPEFPRVSVTRTSSARALPAERLGELFAQAGRTPEHVWPDVATALGALAGEPFVACGSITLAGEVAGILR
jgi:dihydrofolate synthase/folylpolyglutamate synthase